MSQKDKGAIMALIEISREDCPVSRFVTALGEESKVEPLKVGEVSTLHKVESNMATHEIMPQLQKISKNVMRVGKNGYWLEAPSCSACRLFASHNLVVLATRTVDSKRSLYRVLIQNQTKLKILERTLEDAGLKPNILETEYESRSILTKREREVVHTAYRHGYFDPERGISMTEVANMMNVSTPSLSDVLRRGTKKMIKSYVENKL